MAEECRAKRRAASCHGARFLLGCRVIEAVIDRDGGRWPHHGLSDLLVGHRAGARINAAVNDAHSTFTHAGKHHRTIRGVPSVLRGTEKGPEIVHQTREAPTNQCARKAVHAAEGAGARHLNNGATVGEVNGLTPQSLRGELTNLSTQCIAVERDATSPSDGHPDPAGRRERGALLPHLERGGTDDYRHGFSGRCP